MQLYILITLEGDVSGDTLLTSVNIVHTTRCNNICLHKSVAVDSYSLSPITLSFSTADGAQRETLKSKLLDLILKEGVLLTDPKNESSFISSISTFIIDLMAALKHGTNPYEELT